MYTCSGVSVVGKVGAPKGMEGRLVEQQCLVGECFVVGNGGKFQGATVFPYGESGHFQRSGGSFEGLELGDMSWGIQRSLGGV